MGGGGGSVVGGCSVVLGFGGVGVVGSGKKLCFVVGISVVHCKNR